MKNDMRSGALHRLKYQATRLLRLLEHDSPAVILQREILIMERSARLIDPETWGAAVSEIGLRSAKVGAGFCGNDSCERPLMLDPEDWAKHPIEVRTYLRDECPTCAQASAATAREEGIDGEADTSDN